MNAPIEDRLKAMIAKRAPIKQLEDVRLSVVHLPQQLACKSNYAITSSRALSMAITCRHHRYARYLCNTFQQRAISSSPDSYHCCYPSGPLMIAILRGANIEVDYILQEHSRCSSDLHFLNYNNCEDRLHNVSPLRAAYSIANFDAICMLIKHGADIDLDNGTDSYPIDAILLHGLTPVEASRISQGYISKMEQCVHLSLKLMTFRHPTSTNYLQLAVKNSMFPTISSIEIPSFGSLAAITTKYMISNFEPSALKKYLSMHPLPSSLSSVFQAILR